MLSSGQHEESLRHQLRSTIKHLVEVSEKHLDTGGSVAEDDGDDEPLPLGQRAVLRIRGQVPVHALVQLHKAYKSSSVLGGKLVALANQKFQLTGSPAPTHEQEDIRQRDQIISRCAIRVLLEEKLHNLARSCKLMWPYPFRFPTLDLLEMFFQDNQNPNEAEIALLASVGHVASGHIVRWFENKRKRFEPVVLANAYALRPQHSTERLTGSQDGLRDATVLRRIVLMEERNRLMERLRHRH